MASFLVHSAALVAALAVLPQLVGEFWAYTLALYFLYAIASMGIGLCWGQAGILPLGQAMFFGLAAYLSGLSLIHFRDSWLLLVLLPGAALAPGLLAYGIGLLVFRGRTLTGPFFAMITLALTLLAFQIANSWNDVTGGFNGLKNIPGLPGLSDFTDLYYISAAALAVCVLGIAWLRRAPAGVLWRAVAQNEQRVRFCGFPVQNVKAAAFGLSGVLAGIGGFRSLGYTITEDAALVGAASRAGWKVRASTLAETLVTTEAQPDWRAFINQHVRWNGGAFYSNDPAAAWGYRYVTLFLILSVAAAPFALLVPWLLVWPLTSLASIGTLATLAAALYHPRRRRALARVVPYTLFFMAFYAYITVLAIAGVRGEWKGSRLSATHAP